MSLVGALISSLIRAFLGTKHALLVEIISTAQNTSRYHESSSIA
jgi:hypothetical protein